jgi:hypothetical protein
MVVKHVRYWRGAIHKWSTSYQFRGSAAAPSAADCQTLLVNESPLCYQPSTGIWGGAYECVAYAASGGAPLSSYTHFDPDTPSSWIGYSASGWSSFTRTFESAAEVSLQIEWPAGLSSTGKPVFFRKWLHAVPTSAAVTGGAVDIAAADVTALTAKAVLLTNCLASSNLLLSTGARYAGTPVVASYYANHQMPKGRRRKALVTASGRYTGPTINGEPIVPVEN